MKIVKEIRVTDPETNKRGTITIRTKDEYFSITAWFGGQRDGYGGACHEKILELRPEFQGFVDLHLSDLNGVPMHCVQNGLYWLQGCVDKALSDNMFEYGPEQTAEKCFENLRAHLRTTPNETRALIAAINEYFHVRSAIQDEKDAAKEAQNLFKLFVESKKPQWEKEADRALEFLKKLL